MFLGWCDPDRKKPARMKVADAAKRYVEKHGERPETCIASVPDAAELEADSKRTDGLTVKGATYVPRHTFYIGRMDDIADRLGDAA